VEKIAATPKFVRERRQKSIQRKTARLGERGGDKPFSVSKIHPVNEGRKNCFKTKTISRNVVFRFQTSQIRKRNREKSCST